jgi:ribose transport system permease protein
MVSFGRCHFLQCIVRLGVGVLIAKLKIPPFIATLGMMMLLKGLALVMPTQTNLLNDTPNFTSIAPDS